MLDITISIVNWNTKEYLRQCLNSIREYTRGIKYETIVVDNASSDNSTQMIREEFPYVNLIANKRNYGFAKANNQSLEVASGRYFLILNPDTKLLNNAFKKMIDFMDDHFDAGAIGCKVLNPDLTLQLSCRTFPSFSSVVWDYIFLSSYFPKNKIFGKYRMSHWNHNCICQIDQPMGCCLMIRKEALASIGVFDEKFYMYFEEVDLCYRLKKKGWQIYFTPEAQILHFGGRGTSQAEIQMFIERQRSMYKFYKKHYGNLQLLALKILIFINSIIKTSINLTKWILKLQESGILKDMIKKDWIIFRRSW